jgi:hypothetical protein
LKDVQFFFEEELFVCGLSHPAKSPQFRLPSFSLFSIGKMLHVASCKLSGVRPRLFQATSHGCLSPAEYCSPLPHNQVHSPRNVIIRSKRLTYATSVSKKKEKEQEKPDDEKSEEEKQKERE